MMVLSTSVVVVHSNNHQLAALSTGQVRVSQLISVLGAHSSIHSPVAALSTSPMGVSQPISALAVHSSTLNQAPVHSTRATSFASGRSTMEVVGPSNNLPLSSTRPTPHWPQPDRPSTWPPATCPCERLAKTTAAMTSLPLPLPPTSTNTEMTTEDGTAPPPFSSTRRRLSRELRR